MPIRFVTCCKPAQQERRTKSTNAVGADTGDDSVLLRAWHVFFDLLCEIKLSLQFGAHFDDLTTSGVHKPTKGKQLSHETFPSMPYWLVGKDAFYVM